jgi:radical SAM enzyme (TIGR01210 family)
VVTRPNGSRAAGAFVEEELARSGGLEKTATVFLVGRECPFRCTMCDLWKGTTREALPPGAVPAQLEEALSGLPAARHLKLYNAGSFFDPLAIRPEDHASIAALAAGFESLIVECHPALVDANVSRFRDRLRPVLEVAMGLETAHAGALARLKKRMTVDDFVRAARFLRGEEVLVRTFVLLDPPHVLRGEQVDWAVRSIETAFAAGSDTAVLIPVRGGNGTLDEMEREGTWEPAPLESLVEAAERGLALRGGRVFVDLWDIDRFATEPDFAGLRSRLQEINRVQG